MLHVILTSNSRSTALTDNPESARDCVLPLYNSVNVVQKSIIFVEVIVISIVGGTKKSVELHPLKFIRKDYPRNQIGERSL